jgi:hypothetical protein
MAGMGLVFLYRPGNTFFTGEPPSKIFCISLGLEPLSSATTQSDTNEQEKFSHGGEIFGAYNRNKTGLFYSIKIIILPTRPLKK